MLLYERLAEQALMKAGVSVSSQQYFIVVDRNPNVQALLVVWRSVSGSFELIGASPVSTGLPDSFDHFETPLGVFEHSITNPDYRAEGTKNSLGIRGYGVKGRRAYDFGWQRTARGWGDGVISEMRLQMHATDSDLLERRLGSAQSKGCIRIPSTLNTFMYHYGIIDADYEIALKGAKQFGVLDPKRETVSQPGRFLVVVDSGRLDRPDWCPQPYIPHRRPS